MLKVGSRKKILMRCLPIRWPGKADDALCRGDVRGMASGVRPRRTPW